MNTEQILHAARTHGVLPEGAQWPQAEQRPWPVVLLTALGAWLAALPLLGVVGLLLGDIVRSGAGPYVVGLLVLAGAVVVLRSRDLPLFVEQLAVPMLLVGGGSLAFGLFRDLDQRGGALVLALLALALAAGLPRAWLRVPLGALAAVLTMFVLVPVGRFDAPAAMDRVWGGWHVAAALALAGWGLQWAWSRRGRPAWAETMEPVLAGWALAVLAGLALWSGMTLLVGGSTGELGALAQDMSARLARPGVRGMQASSVLLALAAAGWLLRRWPGLRAPACAGAALVFAALAGFLPALGAVLLLGAHALVSRRWALAAAAGFAALWIVGAFYYQLHWSLATKAVVLVAAGVALGALAWVSPRPQAAAAAPALPRGRAMLGIAASALAVLLVANVGIWQKERLIAHGEPVLVELAPVDPRSLMQGDFMRLNFRMPTGTQAQLEDLVRSERPRVVGRRDARGVATLLRLDDGRALAPGELRIELAPKGGRWVLVTDAWYFKEGEAERFANARYGEFRVEPGGKALLVGLRDAALKPL